MSSSESEIVNLSSYKFLGGCAAAAVAIFAAGFAVAIPAWLIAAEVMATVLSLFFFGSMKYRIDKNALTYGMGFIIFATFFPLWWPASGLNAAIRLSDWGAIREFFHHYLLTLHGWDELVHADTMLFILGLTFFVAVVAQTRLLETVSFKVLAKTKGNVLLTLGILTAIVAFLSGILDGVSMIGLLIRTMVIILFLAKIEEESVIFAVIVSTIITTVCGMWLAYGEPPNLIMKANLHPHLDNMFFLRYCLPVAIGSYFIVLWNIRKKMRGRTVDVRKLDILDSHTDDVRFLQATRHGEVLTPVEFAEAHESELGSHFGSLVHRLHEGIPFGEAMVRESVPVEVRRELIGKYVSEDLAAVLDEHYTHVVQGNESAQDESVRKIRATLEEVNHERIRAQKIGGFAFIPFVGLLVAHAINHNIPLFLASFAGFATAFIAVLKNPKMKSLALREARHEYSEYLFLLPLFFSITLLQKTGFFEQISRLLHRGVEVLGMGHVAYLQFTGATFLSAILDNNIVADFGSRALHGLEIGVLHLFAMAQIAGYAVGGCWTHIGSAQSVVAYSFIQKEVNERYTPFQWIRAMTPIILEIFLLMTVVVYGEALFIHFLER